MAVLNIIVSPSQVMAEESQGTQFQKAIESRMSEKFATDLWTAWGSKEEMADRELFVSMIKKNLWILLGVFLICGIFIAGPVFRCRDVCSWQGSLAQDFHRKKYRHAVRRMNRRICRQLKKDTCFGVTWKTELEYEHLLRQTYRQVDELTWKSYVRIVKKAAYSEEEPTADEAIACYDVYKSVLYTGFRR